VAVIGQPGPRGAGRSARDLQPAGVEVLVPAPEELLLQRYLEVRDLQAGEEVVTVVEVLSPSNKHNKRPGEGRDDYIAKRTAVLAVRTNLVEIDLVRSGPRLPALGAPQGADYGILVSRVHTRPRLALSVSPCAIGSRTFPFRSVGAIPNRRFRSRRSSRRLTARAATKCASTIAARPTRR
jgi:hypothetical protein